MLPTSISPLRRAAAASARVVVARRHLSPACARSVHKLNDILEEYRSHNYSQELPRRFQKELVQAATIDSRELRAPAVSAEGIQRVLRNIGMGHRMSRSEIEGIVGELGARPADGEGPDRVLSAEQMLGLISSSQRDRPELGAA